MNHRAIFVLIIGTFLVSFTYSQSCQIVKCGEIQEENVCVNPESTTTIMKSCPNNLFCNIPSEDPVDKAYCTEKPKEVYPLYPGMKCEKDDECINKSCVQDTKTCKALKENEVCTSAEECDYGLTCRKVTETSQQKVCTTPSKQGEACIDDTDCDLKNGCYNKVCTPYFSLVDGQYIGKSTGIANILSLCQSGYSDENGVCQTNVQEKEKTECNEQNPCKYKFGQELMVVPENCLCGYNKDGKSYCKLGSGDPTYKKYIELLKDYYTKQGACHLTERGGDGCVKDILFGDSTIKSILEKLYNAKVEALYNNMIYDADECALAIELPKYTPEKPIDKCAIYKCESNLSNCAASKFTEPNSISVTLSDICKSPEICKVGNPNVEFYVKKDRTFDCAGSTKMRYPGEDCESDSDCIYPLNIQTEKFHKCTEKKCSGMKEGEACEGNDECVSGYYCDTTNKKCAAQKAKDKECKSNYECRNFLLCYEGKCQDVMFSLEAGKSVKDLENPEKFCKSETVYQDQCVEIKGNNDKEDEFVECQFGSTCKYSLIPSSLGNIEKPCGCGFNAEGKGYCPKFHDYKTSEWTKYTEAVRSKADNSCHTLNRYSCYLEDTSNDNAIKKFANTVTNAHLFYKAVECAEKVLSSDILRINFIMLSSIIFALLL